VGERYCSSTAGAKEVVATEIGASSAYSGRESEMWLMGSASSGPRESWTLAYLGWDGSGNMGDVAIREVHNGFFGDRLLSLPCNPRQLPQWVVHPRTWAPHRVHLLLGGGTVIGRRHWRSMLDGNRFLAWARPWYMLGAGVEDPSFQGIDSGSANNELQRWPEVLKRFDRVTVRGPRSAELLDAVGVSAEVVGDPGLLCTTPRTSAVSNGAVGVSLGFGSDLWGHNQQQVNENVAKALSMANLRRALPTIRVIAVNRVDVESARELKVRLEDCGLRSELVVALTPREFLSSIEACSILLGERLHSVVLAAARGVPTIMIEYQPKCRDFMASIGREEWCFRTDRLFPEELADATLSLMNRLDEETELVSRRVSEFQTILRDHANAILSQQGSAFSGDSGVFRLNGA
jgi:hypothetical protein